MSSDEGGEKDGGEDGAVTRLVHAGRSGRGWVNPPITRGSTYLFESVAAQKEARAMRDREWRLSYGARGTDTTHALEVALVELEGGHRARLYPTGLAAIAITLLAYLRAGDHLLITDAAYEPARRFCLERLQPLGIECDFFAADGTAIEALIRPNTRMIYAEVPGSLVYEMCDLRALAELARRHDLLLAVDNTWASGWLCRPLELGADISVLAATKYVGGHADLVLGAVVTNERAWSALESASVDFGQTVGADDAWLALRGLRSLPLRMPAHGERALAVARWLSARPEVRQVFCPALPSHPGHDIWARDFSGTNGLLSVEFQGVAWPAVERMADRLRLFGLGSSWGGFESLVSLHRIGNARTVTDWSGCGPVARFHIGLEEPADLIRDLEQAFQAMVSGAAADADGVRRA